MPGLCTHYLRAALGAALGTQEAPFTHDGDRELEMPTSALLMVFSRYSVKHSPLGKGLPSIS